MLLILKLRRKQMNFLTRIMKKDGLENLKVTGHFKREKTKNCITTLQDCIND